jgi:hypothetical protein
VKNRIIVATTTLLVLTACTGGATSPGETPAAGGATATFGATGTLQDLMSGLVDPSADILWESVGTIVSAAGTDERQPRTAEEWNEVRHAAVNLIEATNLLTVPGRHVVGAGQALADEGIAGNLSSTQIQSMIDSDRATFNGYAAGLNAAAKLALQAIEARNKDGLLAAGEAMDQACESCHLKYWYPNAALPRS